MGATGSTGGAKILPFRRDARSRGGSLPRISDPLSRMEREEDRRRMRENLAAALVILLLLSTGYWLIGELRTSAHIAACLEAGHRNCAALDPHAVQGH
jgi:hypothetical protein